MARDLISRYIWIVDTISRYGRLSRKDLNDLWLQSSISDGRPIPERTFYHYRRCIEDNFHIEILCDSQGNYYIDDSGSKRERAVANWLVDSHAVRNALSEATTVTDRVMVEEVPSARRFLPIALQAIKDSRKICFTYAGFSRSRAEKGIVFRPYLVRLYRQRWYMIGLREKSGELRTYALDRVQEMQILSERFEMPEPDEAAGVFSNLIGMTSSHADVRVVKLKVTLRQAKYLRALPLHETQSEMLHDDYSVFTYRLKLNYELVHEILSWGASVTVLEPPELRAMVIDELKKTLSNYPC